MNTQEFANTIRQKYPGSYEQQSDGDLVNAFVNKYPVYKDQISDFGQQAAPQTPQPAPAPKWYEIEKQQGLPSSIGGMVKDAATNIVESASSPMPGSLLAAPLNALTKTANEAGSSVAQSIVPKSPLLGRFAGFGTAAALNPLTYAGGILGPEAEAGAINKPGILQKIFNLFKNPATDEETEGAVGDVQNMVKGAVDKFGAALNSEKAAVGLPVSTAEKEASVTKFNNPFNISHADLLKTDKGPVFAAKSFNWPEQGAEYYKLMGDPSEITKRTNGQHGLYSDLPKQVIDQLGVQIQESPYLANPKSDTDLVSTIAKFKAEAPNMSASVRARAATALQDQINNFVDWDKKGDTMEGLLKTQHGHLGNIISNVSDSLQGAKAGMAKVLSNVSDISGKMEDPGQAQAFLKRIYNNPTGRNADYLASLRTIESMSGKETLDELFDKFGSQQPLDLRHPIAGVVQPMLQNAGDTVRSVPRILAGPSASLPAALVAAKSGAKPFNQPFNVPQMQSLKDRLKNAQ